MKKILISFAAGACLAIGGVMLVDYLRKDNNDDRCLVTEQQDEQQEVIDLLQYKSADLQMQQAKGNVRTIEYKPTSENYYGKTINYNPDGINEEYLEEYLEEAYEGDVEIKRNSQNQLIYIGVSEYETYEEWTYNDDGFIATHTLEEPLRGYTSQYEYNEKNELVKCVKEGNSACDPESSFISVIIYSNYKYDSRGNWISRDVKEEHKFLDCPEYDFSRSYTEPRVITFYE